MLKQQPRSLKASGLANFVGRGRNWLGAPLFMSATTSSLAEPTGFGPFGSTVHYLLHVCVVVTSPPLVVSMRLTDDYEYEGTPITCSNYTAYLRVDLTEASYDEADIAGRVKTYSRYLLRDRDS